MVAAGTGGQYLDALPPVEVSDSFGQRVMERIQTGTVYRFSRPDVPSRTSSTVARLLEGKNLDSVTWKRTAPGIAVHRILPLDGVDGFFGLLRIEPGRGVPDHGHGGTEITLILEGAYEDELGHFGVGDVADLDETIVHNPVAVGERPCICLAANDARTRFRSWPARLMQSFVRI